MVTSSQDGNSVKNVGGRDILDNHMVRDLPLIRMFGAYSV